MPPAGRRQDVGKPARQKLDKYINVSLFKWRILLANEACLLCLYENQ